MDYDAEVVFFEINAIIAETEAVKDFAVALELSEAFEFGGHDLMRQAAEFAEDVQLQFLRHARKFRRAGRVENNLERAHENEIKG